MARNHIGLSKTLGVSAGDRPDMPRFYLEKIYAGSVRILSLRMKFGMPALTRWDLSSFIFIRWRVSPDALTVLRPESISLPETDWMVAQKELLYTLKGAAGALEKLMTKFSSVATTDRPLTSDLPRIILCKIWAMTTSSGQIALKISSLLMQIDLLLNIAMVAAIKATERNLYLKTRTSISEAISIQ